MKEKNYSAEIANAIKSYLKEDDWHFSFDEETGLFRFGLSLSSKIKKINYIVDVKEDQYIVYAIAPIGADEEDKKMMATMAEFVCRANYGLKNGNFELDMRDGEVRLSALLIAKVLRLQKTWYRTASIALRQCSNATVRESLISSSETPPRRRRLRGVKKRQKTRCVPS